MVIFDILFFLSFLSIVVSVILLIIKALFKKGMTFKRISILLASSFVVFIVSGILMPDPTPEEKATLEAQKQEKALVAAKIEAEKEDKAEQDRVAKEKEEAKKKAEQERIKQEKAEKEKQEEIAKAKEEERKKKEAEKRAEQERLEKEKQEKARQEQLAKEKAAKEKEQKLAEEKKKKEAEAKKVTKEKEDKKKVNKINTSVFEYAKATEVTDAIDINQHITVFVQMSEELKPGLATQHVVNQTYDFLQLDDIKGAKTISINVKQGDAKIAMFTVNKDKFVPNNDEPMSDAVINASEIEFMTPEVKEWGSIMNSW